MRSAQPSVVVDVADTGVGMDQEALAKIFEPYFSTKATGTGLGLTIAKRNVELNGGTIAVVSQRGVGTTVTMTLPLDAAVDAAAKDTRGWTLAGARQPAALSRCSEPGWRAASADGTPRCLKRVIAMPMNADAR